jgi:hypothetical protein
MQMQILREPCLWSIYRTIEQKKILGDATIVTALTAKNRTACPLDNQLAVIATIAAKLARRSVLNRQIHSFEHQPSRCRKSFIPA